MTFCPLSMISISASVYDATFVWESLPPVCDSLHLVHVSKNLLCNYLAHCTLHLFDSPRISPWLSQLANDYLRSMGSLYLAQDSLILVHDSLHRILDSLPLLSDSLHPVHECHCLSTCSAIWRSSRGLDAHRLYTLCLWELAWERLAQALWDLGEWSFCFRTLECVCFFRRKQKAEKKRGQMHSLQAFFRTTLPYSALWNSGLMITESKQSQHRGKGE